MSVSGLFRREERQRSDNNDTSMQLEQPHNVDDTSWSPIVTDDHDVLQHQWRLGVWYDQSSERITRMAIQDIHLDTRMAITRIELFELWQWSLLLRQHLSSLKLRHLQRRILATFTAAACLSQKLSLLCHIKMFVSQRRVTTLHMWVTLCGGSRTLPPPPGACCRSSRTLGSRGLCTPGGSGVVGRADTPAKKIFLSASWNPCSMKTFHVFL